MALYNNSSYLRGNMQSSDLIGLFGSEERRVLHELAFEADKSKFAPRQELTHKISKFLKSHKKDLILSNYDIERDIEILDIYCIQEASEVGQSCHKIILRIKHALSRSELVQRHMHQDAWNGIFSFLPFKDLNSMRSVSRLSRKRADAFILRQLTNSVNPLSFFQIGFRNGSEVVKFLHSTKEAINISRLNLSQLQFSSKDLIQLTDFVKDMGELVELNVSEMSCPPNIDALLKVFTENPKLKSLDLSGQKFISHDFFLSYLSKISTLTELNLSRTAIGGMAFESLSQLKNLKTLVVDNTLLKLSRHGLTNISKLSLEEFVFTPSRETTLIIISQFLTNMPSLKKCAIVNSVINISEEDKKILENEYSNVQFNFLNYLLPAPPVRRGQRGTTNKP